MILHKKLSLLSFAAIALPLPFAVSSTASAQSYTARHVVFQHVGNRFSQAQLETAVHLHAGSSFTTADLSTAAQKLSDTGYFDQVGATVEGSLANLTVVFNLTPSDPAQFLPVGFENLVWMTPDEITKTIQAKLPLYNGTLPEAGPQADTALAELTAALAAKGVTAKLERETVEPTLEYPQRVMEVRVKDPVIAVAHIHLGGVTPEMAPLLQKSVNSTAGTLYNAGKAGFVTEDAILAPLRDAGYEQAAMSGTSVDVGSAANDKVPLALHGTLTPGPLYHVASLTFAGAPLYSADDFAKNAKLHVGDVADHKLLMDTLAPLDAAYRNQGYLDVVARAEPQFDAAKGTVSYTVSVTPGQQYRLHQVTTENLDPAAKADFDRGFAIHPGDIYNPEYVAGFIKKNTALLAFAHYTGAFKAYANPGDHTVDLVITFIPGGNRGNTVTVR